MYKTINIPCFTWIVNKNLNEQFYISYQDPVHTTAGQEVASYRSAVFQWRLKIKELEFVVSITQLLLSSKTGMKVVCMLFNRFTHSLTQPLFPGLIHYKRERMFWYVLKNKLSLLDNSFSPLYMSSLFYISIYLSISVHLTQSPNPMTMTK